MNQTNEVLRELHREQLIKKIGTELGKALALLTFYLLSAAVLQWSYGVLVPLFAPGYPVQALTLRQAFAVLVMVYITGRWFRGRRKYHKEEKK